MPLCRDEAITIINNAGFDVVRVPDARIAPLDLIVERDGGFVRVTSLVKDWTSQAAVPKDGDRPSPDLETVKSSDLRGRFGISILFQMFGKARIGAGGARDSSLRFEAKNCVIRGCDLAEMAVWIAKGEFTDEANLDMIEADDRAWVVVEVLRSDTLSIHVGSGSEASAEVAAENLTKAIKTEIEGKQTTRDGTTIKHVGNAQLTFGFKTAELLYDGHWRLALPEKAGRKFLGRVEESSARATTQRLINPGHRLRLAIQK